MSNRALILSYAFLIVLVTAPRATGLSDQDTVYSNDIVKGAVHSSDIKNGTVRGQDVRNNSLTGADIDESTLDLVSPGGAQGSTGDVFFDRQDYDPIRGLPDADDPETFATVNVPHGKYAVTGSLTFGGTNDGGFANCQVPEATTNTTQGHSTNGTGLEAMTLIGVVEGSGAIRLQCFGAGNVAWVSLMAVKVQ